MLLLLIYGIHGNTGWPLTPIPSSQYSLVSRLITSVRWCLTPTPALSSPTCVGGLLKHPNPPTPHLTEPGFTSHGPDFPPTLNPISSQAQNATDAMAAAEEKPRSCGSCALQCLGREHSGHSRSCGLGEGPSATGATRRWRAGQLVLEVVAW